MLKLVVPENDIDAALAVLSAEELRQLVHGWLHEFDGTTRGHLAASLITRAVRSGSGWMPPPATEAEIDSILAFVRTAKRMGPSVGAGAWVRGFELANLRRWPRRDHLRSVPVAGVRGFTLAGRY